MLAVLVIAIPGQCESRADCGVFQMVRHMRCCGQQKGSMVAQISHYQDKNDQAQGLFTSHEMGFWHRVVAVYMGVLPDLERELQRAGKISFFEFQVLDHLASQDGDMTMSRLASRCSSSLSRLSHVARKLEGRKLLTRRLSQRDKRVTVAEITTNGRQLIEGLPDVYHRAVESHMLESLSTEELRQAIELLDHMLRRNEPDHWLFSA